MIKNVYFVIEECLKTFWNRYNVRIRVEKVDMARVSYFLSKALEKHPLFYQIFAKTIHFQEVDL